SSARLRGRYAIRLCILNHTTGEEHVERVLAFLETAEPAPTTLLPARAGRDRDVGATWLRTSETSPALLRKVPLFRSLGNEERARVARLALLREAAPGERIVDRWETTREFYVLLEGEARVLLDDAPIATVRPGDFFGEHAA